MEEVELDTTSNPGPAPQTAAGGIFLTTDLFLKAMKENRDDIISSFNASIGLLSRRIENNSTVIATNVAAIKQQAEQSDMHRTDMQLT